jgi:hypothetical protein
MSQRPNASGVQFLSRNFLEAGALGGRDYDPLELPKGKELHLSVALDSESGPTDLTFAQPWPQPLSIGAYEFVDPYGEKRWPSRVLLSARIDRRELKNLTVELAHLVLAVLRDVLWASFQSITSLRAAPDQVLAKQGYRRAFYTSTIDINRNPVPSPGWHLAEAMAAEPLGPGFIRLDAIADDRNYHALVWSQAVSVPAGKVPANGQREIEERIQEVKLHWNSYKEIRDAERFAQQGDVKAAVRFAAPALEAAVRFYSALWDVPMPENGTFAEKIEKVLRDAGRPSYGSLAPESLKSLLCLYRARNSMHEADCYYRDPDSGDRVVVDKGRARALTAEARDFLLWLDGLA